MPPLNWCGQARDVLAECRAIARQPGSLTVLGVMAALIGVAWFLAGLVTDQGSRLPPDPEALGLEADAWRSGPAITVLFGAVVAAGYGGMIAGQRRVRTEPHREGTAWSDGLGTRPAMGARFTALALLLLLGCVIVNATGLLVVAVGATAAGQRLDLGLDPRATGGWAVLLLRAWWGLLVPAAAGFGAAVVVRQPAAGLATGIVLLLGEQFASLFAPFDLLRFAPLMNGRVLVGAVNPTDVAVAFVVASVQLVGALGVTWILAPRSNHPIG